MSKTTKGKTKQTVFVFQELILWQKHLPNKGYHIHWDLILCTLKHFLGTHKKNTVIKAGGRGYKRCSIFPRRKRSVGNSTYIQIHLHAGKAVFSFSNISIKQVCIYICLQTNEQIQKLIWPSKNTEFCWRVLVFYLIILKSYLCHVFKSYSS